MSQNSSYFCGYTFLNSDTFNTTADIKAIDVTNLQSGQGVLLKNIGIYTYNSSDNSGDITPTLGGGSWFFVDNYPYIAINSDNKIDPSNIQEYIGAIIPSASTITIPNDATYFHLSGTTTVNLIQSNGIIPGKRITLICDASLLLKNNQSPSGTAYPMLLRGSTDFAANTNRNITLLFQGTNWIEIARTDVNPA